MVWRHEGRTHSPEREGGGARRLPPEPLGGPGPQARALGERPYRLGGACRRCAACCEAPAIRVHALVWLAPLLRRSFLWWQQKVNGFVLVDARRPERTFVFRCTHFDRATRSCDSYASRPGMCRDYPRALLYQASPELLPGCGYRPLARNAAALKRALDARPPQSGPIRYSWIPLRSR